MGLLNLYKMHEMRPVIGYRFTARIWPFDGSFNEPDDSELYNMEYTVKKVTQPTFSLGTDNIRYFGNTAFVIPIFNFGNTSLEITFEETDAMQVYDRLTNMYGSDIYTHALMGLVAVQIKQFDERMVKVVDDKTYICRLVEYSEPNYSNTGFGTPIEFTASFNVVYVTTAADRESQRNIALTENGQIARPVENNEDIFASMSEQRAAMLEKTKQDMSAYNDRMNTYYDNQLGQYKEQAIRRLAEMKREESKARKAEAAAVLGKILDNTLTQVTLANEDAFTKLNNAYGINLTDGVTAEEKNKLLALLKKGGIESPGIETVASYIDKYNEGYVRERALNADNSSDVLEASLRQITKNEDGDFDAALIEMEMELRDNSRPTPVGRTGNSGNPYSRDRYDNFKDMDLSDYRNMKSYGYCAANTATELSIYMGLERRLEGAASGKNFVSDNVIEQINSSGRGEAKKLDLNPTSREEINSYLKKYGSGSDSMFVVSIDLSGIPSDVRDRLIKENPDRESSFKHGHVTTAYEGKVGQNQNSLVTYSFITDEMIKSGQVKFNFMEVKKKERPSTMGSGADFDGVI